MNKPADLYTGRNCYKHEEYSFTLEQFELALDIIRNSLQEESHNILTLSVDLCLAETNLKEI